MVLVRGPVGRGCVGAGSLFVWRVGVVRVSLLVLLCCWRRFSWFRGPVGCGGGVWAVWGCFRAVSGDPRTEHGVARERGLGGAGVSGRTRSAVRGFSAAVGELVECSALSGPGDSPCPDPYFHVTV